MVNSIIWSYFIFKNKTKIVTLKLFEINILIIIKTKAITKKFFCGFEPAKMHCEFMYTTNAFQDESWDLSNSKGYEFDFSWILFDKEYQTFQNSKKIFIELANSILFYWLSN